MRRLARFTVLAAVASAVVGALALKRATRVAEADLMPVSVLSEEIPEEPVPPTYETTGPGLPRLVALGDREGYMAKADILATMNGLGMHVEPASGAVPEGEGA